MIFTCSLNQSKRTPRKSNTSLASTAETLKNCQRYAITTSHCITLAQGSMYTIIKDCMISINSVKYLTLFDGQSCNGPAKGGQNNGLILGTVGQVLQCMDQMSRLSVTRTHSKWTVQWIKHEKNAKTQSSEFFFYMTAIVD